MSEEVPAEDGDDETADASTDDDDNEDSDEDEDEDDDSEDDSEDDEPKTKTITKTVWDWERLNDVKAIWLRSASEVEEEEYTKFYQALAKNTEEPLAYSHFKAEGDVEFKAILYIPERPPADYYDNYYSRASALKLYLSLIHISEPTRPY